MDYICIKCGRIRSKVQGLCIFCDMHNNKITKQSPVRWYFSTIFTKKIVEIEEDNSCCSLF